MLEGRKAEELVDRLTEIAQIEEQHVSHYESLLDPGASWLEREVMHQYNGCWLYWSFMQ